MGVERQELRAFMDREDRGVLRGVQIQETMTAAIEQLQISLDVLTTNEPINRKEGNTEQADLEARNAAEIRQAIAVLSAAEAGPIWPEPWSEKP